MNRASMGNVKKGKFESMEIVSPPDGPSARYHRLVGPMFSEILSLFHLIQTLRRTRDLLLPRLLSGQVELASASANGALPYQPGATPQVSNRKHQKG